MTKKLGNTSAFIGKVGNDNFGLQLEKAIKEADLDTTDLIKNNKNGTTLSLCH